MDILDIDYSDWTLYTYSGILLKLAVAIVTASTIGVTLGELGIRISILSVLVQNPSFDFFGNSLILILNVFSIAFLIVIFLVQNANQAYSNRLSRLVYHDKYFLGSAGFIILASIFNLSGSYFEWQDPLTAIGYAFSISSIIIVGSLVLLAGYFVDVSNIVNYKTEHVKKAINSDNLYLDIGLVSPMPNTDFIQDLTTQCQLITSTCIRGIEENNWTLVETCLDSLVSIVSEYLGATKDDAYNKFFNNLNDEFQFIGSAAFEDDSRQKYAQLVVEKVGEIGVILTVGRDKGTPGGVWASLLKRLFSDAANFERNDAGVKAIDKLGDMMVAAVTRSDFDSFKLYLDNLTEIGEICIRKDHFYFHSLLGNISQEFQKSYVRMISLLCFKGKSSMYDMEQLWKNYTSIFLLAKSQSGFTGRSTPFASLDNPVGAFSVRLAAELRRHLPLDASRQEELVKHLSFINGFLEDIGHKIPTNQVELYKVYAEIFYVFAQFAPLHETNKFSLLIDLNEKWVQLIEKTYRYHMEVEESLDLGFKRNIYHFYAIALYFYRFDSKSIAEFVEPLLEVYLELRSDLFKGKNVDERSLKNLYLNLKLIGAWIDEINDLGEVSPELREALVRDFFEVDTSWRRIPSSGLEKYSYPPTRDLSGSNWQLSADPLWSDRFQDNIEQLLNGGDGKHYEQFHEELRARQNLRKAVNSSMVLKGEIHGTGS